MSSSTKIVVVTGVGGFVGSHVARELMERGYAVRGTARGAKAPALRDSIKGHYPRLEVVQIDDLATEDLTEVLEGAYAICHVASPLPYAVDHERLVKSAIQGTLNVLHQAFKAGVRKFVITSSWAAIVDPGNASALDTKRVLTEKDWSCIQHLDQVDMSQGPLWVYDAVKSISERAAWDFAKRHPEVDLATVTPPTIYGPFVPHFPVRSDALASNMLIYALLLGKNPVYLNPGFVDVRDVARVHVSAIELPSSPDPEGKRLLPFGGTARWSDFVKYLMEHRPDVEHRLPPLDIIVDFPDVARTDPSRTMKTLNIEKWIPWQDSLNEAVDSLLAAERGWSPEETAIPAQVNPPTEQGPQEKVGA